MIDFMTVCHQTVKDILMRVAESHGCRVVVKSLVICGCLSSLFTLVDWKIISKLQILINPWTRLSHAQLLCIAFSFWLFFLLIDQQYLRTAEWTLQHTQVLSCKLHLTIVALYLFSKVIIIINKKRKEMCGSAEAEQKPWSPI